MSAYACVASLPGEEFDAQATIAKDSIVLLTTEGQRRVLPFVDLTDMRLLNYHLHLSMRDDGHDGEHNDERNDGRDGESNNGQGEAPSDHKGEGADDARNRLTDMPPSTSCYEAVLSKLGYQTEEFFEKLWQAYEAKSQEALFVAGDFIMESEGDYAYAEPGVEKSSIAKLSLYSDCLCIVPHDVGARRVPLCFAEPPVRDGFALSTRLDTGESYRIARLGGDTDPFFTKLGQARDKSVADWQAAHRELESNLQSRLGDRIEAYRAFRAVVSTGSSESSKNAMADTDARAESTADAIVTCGLFAADDDAFWFAAIADGRAAVELVTDEKAATYLYRFSTTCAQFENSVRHAMEAVKKNRRIIYLPQDELAKEPLYRMAIDRSSPVRFLRSCNVGRIIHSANWEERLTEFFA